MVDLIGVTATDRGYNVNLPERGYRAYLIGVTTYLIGVTSSSCCLDIGATLNSTC